MKTYVRVFVLICILMISFPIYAGEIRGIKVSVPLKEQEISQCSKNSKKACYDRTKEQDRDKQYLIRGLEELTFKTKTSVGLVNGKVGVITIEVLTPWKGPDFNGMLEAKYGPRHYGRYEEKKKSHGNQTYWYLYSSWSFDDSELYLV